MNHAKCFDLVNDYGTFSVSELVTPGKEYTSDILVVTRSEVDSDDNMQIISYTCGATLMTEEEIMLYFYNSVAEYIADTVPQEQLKTAFTRLFKEPGKTYFEFSFEK